MRKASSSKTVSKAAKQMRMFTKLAFFCKYLIDEQCCEKNLQVNFTTGKDGDGDNVACGGLTLVDKNKKKYFLNFYGDNVACGGLTLVDKNKKKIFF